MDPPREELRAISTTGGTLSAVSGVFPMGSNTSRRVSEAIRIMSDIIGSQEAEKAGKRHEYYEAIGQGAHVTLGKKGVKISGAVYFSYETFRADGHFIVVAKALPNSELGGKIIYESKTGKWAGTEDIRQGWLP
jgi:hypothetical protein